MIFLVMEGLMLHCGASSVDYQQVVDSTTPPSTETHYPIPHVKLIEEVRGQIANSNLTITEEAHSLTKGGDRYFGLMKLTTGDHDRQDYSAVLGIRNSHDKKFPSALTIGSSVFVCDNVAFSGEVKLARRHTRFILRDLPGVVSKTFGQLNDAWGVQNKRFDAYKGTDLIDMEAHDLIVRAHRQGGCNATHIAKVADQWMDPNHPEFQDRNAWSLFNAFTEVLKGNLNDLPKRTQALHALFDGHCGISLDKQPILEAEVLN